MTFAALVARPGTEPDDKTPTYDTAREAWQHHVRVVETLWDTFPDDENGGCVEAHTALHVQDQSQPGAIEAPAPGLSESTITYSVIER